MKGRLKRPKHPETPRMNQLGEVEVAIGCLASELFRALG